MTMKEAMEKLSIRELAELIEENLGARRGYNWVRPFWGLFNYENIGSFQCKGKKCDDYREGKFGEAICLKYEELDDYPGAIGLNSECEQCAEYSKECTIQEIMELLNAQVDCEES